MLDVYIDPWNDQLLNDNLFDFEGDGKKEKRVDSLLPWNYLYEFCQENRITLKTADKIPKEISKQRKYLYYSFGQLEGYKRIKNRTDIIFGSFYLFEPPIKVLSKKNDIYYNLSNINSVFNRIYTTCPIKSVNESYGMNYSFKIQSFCYPQSHSMVLDKFWNNSSRKFLVMINSYRYSRLESIEYYSERINALKYFFKKGIIDLYGENWDKLSGNTILNFIESLLWTIKWMNRARLRDFSKSFSIRAQLRKVKYSDNKYSTLSKYKYAICYESMGIEGFISEKIFECFFSGTIPIYLGAPNIADLVPPNTFIDKRSFANYDDLLTYLKNLSDHQYNDYRKNILEFLSSKAFYPFTMEAFAKNFLKDVLEDMGSRKR